jgi:hypothetical protein
MEKILDIVYRLLNALGRTLGRRDFILVRPLRCDDSTEMATFSEARANES